MKTLNFNLRTLQTKNETSILLIVRFQGFRVRLSTKSRVFVAAWDFTKQRVNPIAGSKNYKHINQALEAIERSVKNYLQTIENKNELISLEQLKKQLNNIITRVISIKPTDNFWDLFDSFVAYKEKTTNSHKDYTHALRKHLQLTEVLSGIPLTFEALHYKEQGFVEHMRNYLYHDAINQKGTLGLQVNTIWKQFKNLKAFLNWCFDHAYVEKFSTKHMQIPTEVPQQVYLTEEELEALENLPLTSEAKIVRDLFLISCETGMRFSDVSQIEAETCQSGQFEIFPKKTRHKKFSNRILIPLSSRVKRIMGSYENHILPQYAYSKIHTFNKLLKEICELAGIDSTITYYRSYKGQSMLYSAKKFELISSHTGRRTFCTLKFLAGMPSHVIMKFSGHSSEQNFLRYLRLEAEVTATAYKSFFQ